jgi:tetratricopeptide (TPR) repeat protein
MKQQGDVFFRNGDFKSAINAYEQAIDGSDRQFVAAFSNRAAARLKLGLAKTALNDCDEALALIAEPILTPEVAKMKVRLLSRKTQALLMEKRFPEAFQSCAEILKYQRQDPLIREDIDLLIRLSGAKLRESKELAELLEKIESGSKPQTEAPESEPK